MPNLFNGAMWLITTQLKIFNPGIEESFSCIESNCRLKKRSMIKDQSNGTLLNPSNMFTTLLKKFNPCPENVVDCADCSDGITTNGFESDFMNPSNDNCNHNSCCMTVKPQTFLPIAHPSGLLLNFNHSACNNCKGDNPHPDTMPSGCSTVNYKTASIYSASMPQTLKTVSSLNTGDSIIEIPAEAKSQKAAKNPYTVTPCNNSYKKPSYVVLVGDRVRTCSTKLYASLPLQNKYMVKQRVEDSTGTTKIKLVLKSSHER